MNRSADIGSGLALAALGAYVVAQAWQWDSMTAEGPGPGFFPLIYGIAMIALSLLLVVNSLRRPRAPGSASAETGSAAGQAAGSERSSDARVLATWLALLITVGLMKVIGFIIAFSLLTLWIVAVLYQQSWRRAALVAITSAVAFEVLFALALGVELPVGPLGF
jgi:putative tricarboxylic transport membrane protein